jgi:hypothetical protein
MAKFGILILTIAIGVSVAKFQSCHRTATSVATNSIDATNNTAPPPADVTFTPFAISIWHSDYLSSDGKSYRFSCFERRSVRIAKRELNEYRHTGHLVERGAKVNDEGQIVGERIVLSGVPALEREADIAWTERSRIFRITAPSVEDARMFETRRIWVGYDPCIDVAALRKKLNLQ